MKKKLLIIAGEPSGDLHGSNLMKELKKKDTNIEFFGVGGDKMIDAGLKASYHIRDLSFLGIIEVIKHIPFIKKVKKNLISLVNKEKIGTAVLIDYPGFNLSIAKSLHILGIKNIYYISPQIWAWGKGRIKKIKKIIDKMIVFFPFEEKLYQNNNVASNFVGHPLVKSISNYNFCTKNELIKKLNLDNDKDILLLLPGSRKQELEKILPIVLEASEKISKKFNLQTVVACADSIDEDFFNSFAKQYHFHLVKGNTYNLLKNSKFGIIKSGTSTLEAGIIGTPFIVVYKTNYLTYLIGKTLIKIKNIALVNIVAEKNIITELIQNDVTSEKLFKECSKVLSDEKKYNLIKDSLGTITAKLKTEGNPSKKAAEIIYTELNAV